MYFGHEKLLEAVPSDSSRQVHPHFQVLRILSSAPPHGRIMDLGCGVGNTRALFQNVRPGWQWYGLDIAYSPEVNSRKGQQEFYTYDGIHIPFPDDYFDVIYSNQVLEHVVRPFELIKEIHRVLKPNGYLVGSVSYLEPFHSYSVFNYTPLGVKVLFNDHGLHLRELRPGPDVFTALLHTFFGRIPFLSKLILHFYDNQSLFNHIVTFVFTMLGKTSVQINLVKLFFSAHLRFLAQKVAP